MHSCSFCQFTAAYLSTRSTVRILSTILPPRWSPAWRYMAINGDINKLRTYTTAFHSFIHWPDRSIIRTALIAQRLESLHASGSHQHGISSICCETTRTIPDRVRCIPNAQFHVFKDQRRPVLRKRPDDPGQVVKRIRRALYAYTRRRA